MAAEYWTNMKKNDPEQYKKIREEEEECECGFIIRKIKMKAHENSDLHEFLMEQEYGKVKGKDKVKCPHCPKKITLSGLLIHIEYNHK